MTRLGWVTGIGCSALRCAQEDAILRIENVRFSPGDPPRVEFALDPTYGYQFLVEASRDLQHWATIGWWPSPLVLGQPLTLNLPVWPAGQGSYRAGVFPDLSVVGICEDWNEAERTNVWFYWHEAAETVVNWSRDHGVEQPGFAYCPLAGLTEDMAWYPLYSSSDYHTCDSQQNNEVAVLLSLAPLGQLRPAHTLLADLKQGDLRFWVAEWNAPNDYAHYAFKAGSFRNPASPGWSRSSVMLTANPGDWELIESGFTPKPVANLLLNPQQWGIGIYGATSQPTGWLGFDELRAAQRFTNEDWTDPRSARGWFIYTGGDFGGPVPWHPDHGVDNTPFVACSLGCLVPGPESPPGAQAFYPLYTYGCSPWTKAHPVNLLEDSVITVALNPSPLAHLGAPYDPPADLKGGTLGFFVGKWNAPGHSSFYRFLPAGFAPGTNGRVTNRIVLSADPDEWERYGGEGPATPLAELLADPQQWGWAIFGATNPPSGWLGFDSLRVEPRSVYAWPNQFSKANSDDWLWQNHDAVLEMRPTVLVLNFMNDWNNATSKTESLIAALELSSRYRSFRNSNAPPFLRYQVAKYVDLRDPPGVKPNDNSTKYPWDFTNRRFMYERLYTEEFAAYCGYPGTGAAGPYLTLSELVNRGLVHELWFFAYHKEYGDPLETTELKQYYDESRNKRPGVYGPAGNGHHAAMPWIGRSFRITFINGERGIGCALENFGHAVEGMAHYNFCPWFRRHFYDFGGFNLNSKYGTPFNAFYAYGGGDSNVFPAPTTLEWHWQGQTGTVTNYVVAGGNVHFMPSGRGHYDLDSPYTVTSTVEHAFRGDEPGGQDLAEPWHKDKFAGYRTLAGDCMGPWLVFWRQAMPGCPNPCREDAGQPMRNWWVFLFH